jgi:hypothetical protein
MEHFIAISQDCMTLSDGRQLDPQPRKIRLHRSKRARESLLDGMMEA